MEQDEETGLKCPLCGEEIPWVLVAMENNTPVATYGCSKRCTEKVKAFFKEKSNG